eukprot:gnl/MRDRNA2_/MRDRNA2_79069_c0_seq1.p1 gnl/MRDRNA2_/MRDRNA2_79069_c0~~gnl/MRDRNA2_/MRDRNA2_79069_c0_seq1.p1  ORF type:complete len:464 (-),score=80.00 gnl/MRDRNA2_/MRDRNA2_79069_c0_seq1:392-1783(-)
MPSVRISIVFLLALQVSGKRYETTQVSTLQHDSVMMSESNTSKSSIPESQRKLIEWQISKCIEPDNSGQLSSAQWQEVWDKTDFDSRGSDGWGNCPFSNCKLPAHMIVGLSNNPDKFQPNKVPKDEDSDCFKIDYNEANPGKDPTGCRVFKKSFSPLKDLRTCIVDKLNKDAVWQKRFDAKAIFKDGNFSGTWEEWCAHAIWGYTPAPLQGLSSAVYLCSLGASTLSRAEEMIKFVLFSPLKAEEGENPTMEYAIKQLERKILKTTYLPGGKESKGTLEPATTKAIMSECFEVVEKEPDLTFSKFKSLQKIGICLPLMFDKVESQGFGIQNAAPKFAQEESFSKLSLQRLSYFDKIPTVCGRLALASIPKVQSARYFIGDANTLKNQDRNPKWSSCTGVKQANCRRVYFCWEKALKKLCALQKQCCPDKSIEIQQACAQNSGGSTLSYIKGFFTKQCVIGKGA